MGDPALEVAGMVVFIHCGEGTHRAEWGMRDASDDKKMGKR